MTEQRLSRAEFADALHKGLGRAAVHVRSHGDVGVREELLHACLHDVSFLEKGDYSRAGWLLRMIDRTADPAFYGKAILAKLSEYDGTHEDDEWFDWVQIFDFALHYAKRGVAEAKPLIYRACELRLQTSSQWLGFEEILVLDGVDGLDWLLRRHGQILAVEDHDPAYFQTVALAKEKIGAEVVEARLAERATEDPAIAAFLATRDEDEAEDEDVAEAEDEDDRAAGTRRLHRYSEPEPRWPLLDFRRLGRQHLASASTSSELSWAVVLLKNNFEEQDIEPLVAKLPRHRVTDKDERGKMHELGEQITDLAKAFAAPSLPVMLWLYESTPCTQCRNNAVRYLLKWNLLPARIAAECRDDASEETRGLFDAANPSNG